MQREQSCFPAAAPPQWKVFRHSKVAGKSQSFSSKPAAARAVIVLCVVFSFFVAAVSVPWINNYLSITSTASNPIAITTSKTFIISSNTSNPVQKPPPESPPPPPLPPPPETTIPFSCAAANQTKTATCKPIPAIPPPENSLLSPSCPDYFRWIHEDLGPWRPTGITKEMVERAGRTANFRLVILGGRAFVQHLRPSFQTRDVFTMWGIVQLLRRYPGRVPDLDLMFDTVDIPVVKAADYRERDVSAEAAAPPPVFRYCGDDETLDVVFPDWSFWGWPEINIKPWEKLSEELKEANEEVKWKDREPYAYWKGNPAVAPTRRDLLRCNVSESHDWNARLYAQDWLSEINKGFKESNLSSQCIHRYKIYIEGTAWSVSEKYILACNSMTLIVKPRYYDFFTRGIMPVQHYWPVRDDDKCRSIKFAVDWANSHKRKAQAIGNEASSFIQEKLKMDYVYDYMFHLLNEYSKLLRFRPEKPSRAVELCAEAMACPAQNLTKRFMMDSMVRSPHGSPPCALSPPFTSAELRALQSRKANSIKQVENWEERAWESQRDNY